MASRIKGQEEVLCALDEHIGRSELGLTAPGLPLGGFLFVGPTGVGKTETAKSLTEYLFGGSAALCRLDMSEFKAASSVEELRGLIGARRAGGARTFLFDEIEKAHPEVMDLLLQILDASRMGLRDGSVIGFDDCYVIMSSNIGAKEAMRSRTSNYTMFSNTVLEYVKRKLRPELLGRIERIGKVMVFRKLEEAQQRAIATYHLGETLTRMASLGHRVSVDARAFEFIMRRGFHAEYGARPLLGVIAQCVEGAVASALRSGLPFAQGVLTEREDGAGLSLKAMASIAA